MVKREAVMMIRGDTFFYPLHDSDKTLRVKRRKAAVATVRQLGLFEAEIRSILGGQHPRLVHMMYSDVEVHKVDTYQAGQPIMLAPVGGGGTDFGPCFRWLEERAITPQTLLFLTDLCGTFPGDVPPYPVFRASTETGLFLSDRSSRWRLADVSFQLLFNAGTR